MIGNTLGQNRVEQDSGKPSAGRLLRFSNC